MSESLTVGTNYLIWTDLSFNYEGQIIGKTLRAIQIKFDGIPWKIEMMPFNSTSVMDF